MSENLAFKGKMVWFGLYWFGLDWFGLDWFVFLCFSSCKTLENCIL